MKQPRDFRSWEKIAIVTDREWIRTAAKASPVLRPGRERVFESSELEQARAWVRE